MKIKNYCTAFFEKHYYIYTAFFIWRLTSILDAKISDYKATLYVSKKFYKQSCKKRIAIKIVANGSILFRISSLTSVNLS